MPASLNEFIDLLDLEELEVGLYRGPQPKSSSVKRVFGGQVAAQALMAAQRSVPDDRHVHSLHLYFILGGDPSIPIVYDVENVRDGRSFTTRRVAARQHGEIIFYMTASFQVVEDGWDHQDVMPDVPGPDESTPLVDIIKLQGDEAVEHWKKEWSSFDLRYIGDNRAADDPQRELVPAVQRLWFKADGVAAGVADDPQRRLHLHQRPEPAGGEPGPARAVHRLAEGAAGVAGSHDLVPPAGHRPTSGCCTTRPHRRPRVLAD